MPTRIHLFLQVSLRRKEEIADAEAIARKDRVLNPCSPFFLKDELDSCFVSFPTDEKKETIRKSLKENLLYRTDPNQKHTPSLESRTIDTTSRKDPFTIHRCLRVDLDRDGFGRDRNRRRMERVKDPKTPSFQVFGSKRGRDPIFGLHFPGGKDEKESRKFLSLLIHRCSLGFFFFFILLPRVLFSRSEGGFESDRKGTFVSDQSERTFPFETGPSDTMGRFHLHA